MRGGGRAAANGSIKFMGALRWCQTLGWLAPSTGDAWHGSHAPRQLFHPSTGDRHVLPSSSACSPPCFRAPYWVDGYSCSGNPPSLPSLPQLLCRPAASFRQLSGVPTLADATNLASAPGTTCVLLRAGNRHNYSITHAAKRGATVLRRAKYGCVSRARQQRIINSSVKDNCVAAARLVAPACFAWAFAFAQRDRTIRRSRNLLYDCRSCVLRENASYTASECVRFPPY